MERLTVAIAAAEAAISALLDTLRGTTDGTADPAKPLIEVLLLFCSEVPLIVECRRACGLVGEALAEGRATVVLLGNGASGRGRIRRGAWKV